MQINYLYSSDFPFKNVCKLAQHAETIRKNILEKGNDAYPLSIREHHGKTHFNLFLYHSINVKENVFSERELKKALRDTLTRAAWYGLLLTTA